MILLHKSLKRSEEFMKSLKYFFSKNCKTLDGIIEIFNNGINQGYMIKTFYTYNMEKDLVIWIYESIQEKCIKVGYSTLSNVDKTNNWKSIDKINFKNYPITMEIKKKVVNDIYDNIVGYYGLNEIIDNTWELKI